jgi:hypothetical protein
MSRVDALSAALLLAAIIGPGTASAQESNLVTPASANVLAPAGWSITPSLTYGAGWDDNVLVQGNGDAKVADVLNVINPRAVLDLNGRRGQISATYDGAFLLYRDRNALDSYDQHSSFFGHRLLTPHLAVFARNSAASVPTTELSQLTATPFIRTGSRLDDLHTGIEAAFTKRTSIVASYNFQWVQFDPSAAGSASLLGGHSHGGSMTLTHLLTERFGLVAAADLQHATIGAGTQAFDVQNYRAGGDYKLSALTHVFAEAGISRLGVTTFSEARVGPAVRLGLARQFRTAGLDLLYSRSFVPSYGFGGTMENEEASARFRLPLSRRAYSTSALSWRRNDPLTVGELPLRSYWLEGTLGYAITPWVHLEMFYAGTRQTIDRPGGTVDRNRIGFQLTTAKPVRIQ